MNKITLHSYFGGKSKIGNWIQEVIPTNFKTYAEPFSGSFAVYFLTDIKDDANVIYNDLNVDQANLFSCSKEYDKFNKVLKYNLNDPKGLLYCPDEIFENRKEFYKELYYKLKNSEFRNEKIDMKDFDRATYYAFLLTSAFSSCSYTAAGFSGFNKERMKLLTFIKKLENEYIQKKLDKITKIETLNFEEFIKKYDNEDTFFYLDPPYFSNDNNGNDTGKRSGWYGTKNSFGQEEHFKLLELLKHTKAKWALSYYYFPALEEHLPKDKYVWLEKDFFRSSASFSDNKDVKGTELLILNYDPSKIKNDPKKEDINECSKIIEDFSKKLIDSQKSMEPEIQKYVNDNFWNMIDKKENKTDSNNIDDFLND